MNIDNEIAPLVVIDMLKEGLVPSDKLFDITEEQLTAYIRLYGIYSDKGKSLKLTKQRISYRYARKLAGLTLIKLKLQKGAKANQCKEGFVYTVSNPAWPNHLKLGMSVDVKKRIANYQTYSPFRDYKMTNYEFVFNRRKTEQAVIDKFGISLEAGEWLKDVLASDIMTFIRDNIPAEPSW